MVKNREVKGLLLTVGLGGNMARNPLKDLLIQGPSFLLFFYHFSKKEAIFYISIIIINFIPNGTSFPVIFLENGKFKSSL